MDESMRYFAAGLPAFTDDPTDRLRHTLGAYEDMADDAMAVRATSGLRGFPAITGLTWGDLREILRRLDG
jgi:hypothetical protein